MLGAHRRKALGGPPAGGPAGDRSDTLYGRGAAAAEGGHVERRGVRPQARLAMGPRASSLGVDGRLDTKLRLQRILDPNMV